MKVLAISCILSLGALVLGQNCGPAHGNTTCTAGKCCSQYGWCDTSADHCDPTSCQPSFSGPGSSCASLTSPKPTTITSTTRSTSSSTTTSSKPNYSSSVPEIDVCGTGSNGVSCPGAGLNGYYYRCCSSHGHCGPKNSLQDQALYCAVSSGCQPGFGDCNAKKRVPKQKPNSKTKTVGNGETCGPIVNAKCGAGLCCSGSNFYGTGADFCGAANWCQQSWGLGACTA